MVRDGEKMLFISILSGLREREIVEDLLPIVKMSVRLLKRHKIGSFAGLLRKEVREEDFDVGHRTKTDYFEVGICFTRLCSLPKSHDKEGCFMRELEL